MPTNNDAPTFDSVVDELYPKTDSVEPAKPSLGEVYADVAHLPAPATSAKVIDHAKKTGEDPDLIHENLPAFDKAMSAPTQDNFDVVQKQFPATAQAFTNKETMASASDDLENAAIHEHINKELTRVHGIGDAIKLGLQSSILGMEFRGKLPDIALAEDSTFAEKFASSASQFAADFPYMAAGGVAGAAVGGPLVGFGASFAIPDALRETLKQHYASGDHESAADILKQALTLNTLKAGVKGFGVGILTGGAGAIGKSIGPLTATAAELATMTTAGAAMEGKAPKAEDIASNALLVALMHGSAHLGQYGLDRAFPQRVAETIKLEATHDAAELLDKASRSSKLRERAPEKFENLMNQNKPVLIPVKDYESYFQGKGIDPEQVSNDLGVAPSHNEARQTGGSVVIPQGKYLSEMMDPHRAGLVDHVKFDAGDMTANEVKENDKLVKERVQKVMADSDAAIKAEPERKEAFDNVFEKHKQLLLDAGIPEKEANEAAKIVAGHYTTEAFEREQGQSALDIYNAETQRLRPGGVGEPSEGALEQGKEKLSPAWNKFLKTSKITKDIILHGTTKNFTIFKKEFANPEADWGAGFYMTNAKEDVAKNYATEEGADITQKIERRAEQIESEDEVPREDALKKARSEFASHGGATMPVRAKMENPFVVGGPKETHLEMQYEYEDNDPEKDIIGENGTLIDFINNLRDEASNYNDGDVGPLIQSLLEDGDGITASQLYDKASSDDKFSYFTDDNGTMVSKEILRAALERTGFDGIEDHTPHAKFGPRDIKAPYGTPVKVKGMEGMTPETVHYVAFKSEQIKSAFNEKPTNDPDILKQQAANAPTFYSKMQKDIEAKLPEKASAEQVQALLRDAKEDERKYSGIDDFLKGKDKINKAELLDFLRGNQLEIKEVERGGDKASEAKKLYDRANELEQSGETDEVDALRDRAAKIEEGQEQTKYADYQLPGGQNYRELLLTMPGKGEKVQSNIDALSEKIGKHEDAMHQFPINSEPYKKLNSEIEKMMDERDELAKQEKPKEFESTHFYGVPNIIAHVRFNDRVDSEGKKVLFLEEVQSDWHQKGRRQGYQAAEPDKIDKLPEGYKVVNRPETARQDGGYFIQGPDGLRSSSIHPSPESAQNEVINMLNDEARRKAGFHGSPVPDAPFKKTWHEFALKRMIRYAAENGYDKIGWTTGEQQAERYDLSKQVEAIHYQKAQANDLYHVWAIDKKGDRVEIGDHPAARLPDVVGKDIADKIISGDGKEDVKHGKKVLSGVDLKVGGEGMKGFYDKMLPSAANKLGKKFGAEVGESTLPSNKTVGQSASDMRWYLFDKEGMIDTSKNWKTEKEALAASGPTTHSMPITPELKRAALNEGFPLFQGSEAKGEYVPSLNEIRLGKDADASTYMHEFFHGALKHMFEFTKSGQATQGYLDRFKAMSDFLDIKPDQEKLTVDQQEKGARAFERYLRGEDQQEGATRAPSQELRGAFAMYRGWLTKVYRQIKGSPIEGELTPEAHDFFDRMLATEDQIEAAKRDTGYQPSEIQDLPNADPAKQARVRTLQERAHEKAVDILLKEQMDELRDENKKALDKERSRLTEQETPKVADQPIYRAMQDVEENRPGPRRSAASLADDFLADKLSDQEKGAFEAAAAVHDFADGRDLAESIKADSEAGGLEGTIKQRVEKGMKPFADMKDTEKIKAAALEAIHNDRSAEVLALEDQILSEMQHDKEMRGEITKRARTQASADAKAIKEQARDLLASKSYKEAGAFRPYFTAERKAAVRVSEALRNEDFAEAAKAKREQAMNHALATEALRNQKEIARDGKYLSKFAKRGADMMNMPQGFISHIDDLLSGRGLKAPRDPGQEQTMKRIADEMMVDKASLSEIANATGYVQGEHGWQRETLPDFVARINDENYVAMSLPDSVMQNDSLKQANPSMTMAELRDLKTAVKMLNYVGTQFERFLSDFIKGDLKTNASQMRASIEANIGTPHGQGPAFGSLDLSRLQKAVDLIKDQPDGMIASKVNLLTLCDYLDLKKDANGHFQLDPDGAAKNNIYRPLREATNNEKEMRAEYADKLNEIREKHYTKAELKKFDDSITTWQIPGERAPRRLTKENALVMLLNRGSESNMDRLRNGFQLTDEQIKGYTDLLDKRDHDFAQDVWEYVDTLWPKAAALEMDVKGVEPQKVKAAPVESRHGTYKGGYYPLSYDFEKSADAYKTAIERNALYKQYSTTAAHTEQGALQQRVQTLSRPVRLDFDGLFNHLDNVIHDITHRKAIIDVSRFMNMPDAKTALTNAIGIEGYRKIGEDLKAAGSAQGDFLTDMDKKLRWFRFASTMSTLGYRISIFPRRISEDVMNSMREVGFRNTLGAVGDFVKTPTDMMEFNRQNSVVMRDRAVNRERDLMDMSRQWKGKDSWMKRFAFMQDTVADQALSHPIWNSVYKNNLEARGHDRAVQLADEAILKTFGGGDTIDKVGAQRGGEVNKLVSMYYSWHSMMFNRAWLQGKIAGLEYNENNYGKATAIIASTVATSIVIPAAIDIFWSEMLRNAPEGQEDEEKKKKRWTAKALETPFAYFPLARNVAAFAIPELLGEKGRSYKMSPAEDAIENLTKTVAHGTNLMIDPDKEYDERFIEDAMRSGSLLLGTPMQLNSWALNYADWLKDEGEANWRDLVSRRKKN